MNLTVLEIITKPQLDELREAGWVVVHREPTESMLKAGTRNRWPEYWDPETMYHAAVAESIRLQNIELRELGLL
jgi:hypothetical protein